jgi:hypothetical protein
MHTNTLNENNNTAAKPVEKNKDTEADLDLDEFEASSEDDETALALEDDSIKDKLATRRKIEMYWEKRRLAEQIGDLDEADFDF